MPEDRLLLEIEAADLLNVSSRTLEGWRRRGEGPPFVKLAHHIRYDKAQLIEYMRKHTHFPAVSRTTTH